jgi:hypothetical protein
MCVCVYVCVSLELFIACLLRKVRKVVVYVHFTILLMCLHMYMYVFAYLTNLAFYYFRLDTGTDTRMESGILEFICFIGICHLWMQAKFEISKLWVKIFYF